MVAAVRGGASIRGVADRWGVSVGQVHYWVKHCKGQRLDRVDFSDRKRGARRAWNRSPPALERRVLTLRRDLQRDSVLGEYGAAAIQRSLQRTPERPLPALATIHRILVRWGAVDAHRRCRRPPPPRGWYLPAVANGAAEVDCFDVITDLKVRTGPWFSVLTATALHGGQVQAWPREQVGTPVVVACLMAHWRELGRCTYAQFDNDTLFQGAHQFPDTLGRVIRFCLAVGVTPVFAPPREPGFQNAIEGFNGLWQAKVWQRFEFADMPSLCAHSARYVVAHRQRNARRSEAAPHRPALPQPCAFDPQQPPRGRLIYLRRTDDHGRVALLGHVWPVDPQWVHRLVRCEVEFDAAQIQCYALRRRDPQHQPLLKTIPYRFPNKPFRGSP